MIDTQTIMYVCPNNRKTTNGIEDGHFYRMHTSQPLKGKKWPKCPYCKKRTEMINYDKDPKNEQRTDTENKS
jgi:hypothetical protein